MKKRKEDAQLISLTSLTGDHHHGQSCIVTVAVPLEFRSWAYADRCYVVCRSACEFGSLGCAVQNAQIDFFTLDNFHDQHLSQFVHKLVLCLEWSTCKSLFGFLSAVSAHSEGMGCFIC